MLLGHFEILFEMAMKEPDLKKTAQHSGEDDDKPIEDGLRLVKAFVQLSPAQRRELIEWMERRSPH